MDGVLADLFSEHKAKDAIELIDVGKGFVIHLITNRPLAESITTQRHNVLQWIETH